MAVVIRLQGLPIVAGTMDIRHFFSGLTIPDGGVHIVGVKMLSQQWEPGIEAIKEGILTCDLAISAGPETKMTMSLSHLTSAAAV